MNHESQISLAHRSTQTPFAKLSFTAFCRSPVFTVLRMICPYLLLLSGTVARLIAAAEAPRPRGVGPECLTPPQCLYRSRDMFPDQLNSCQILQRLGNLHMYISPLHTTFHRPSERRFLRLPGRFRRTWHLCLRTPFSPFSSLARIDRH